MRLIHIAPLMHVFNFIGRWLRETLRIAGINGETCPLRRLCVYQPHKEPNATQSTSFLGADLRIPPQIGQRFRTKSSTCSGRNRPLLRQHLHLCSSYVESGPRRLDRCARANLHFFFGGVPEVIVPDNLKSGVTHPSRYEPDHNPLLPGDGSPLWHGGDLCPEEKTAGQGQGRGRGEGYRALDPGRPPQGPSLAWTSSPCVAPKSASGFWWTRSGRTGLRLIFRSPFRAPAGLSLCHRPIRQVGTTILLAWPSYRISRSPPSTSGTSSLQM